MTPATKKVIIISSCIAGGLLVGGVIIVPAIRRSGVRKRLEAAYKNPNTIGGGMDKMLMEGVFDMNRFDDGNNNATITRMEAREKAEQIWENYSWYSTNQPAIVSAFNGLKHVDDVSKIAHEFFQSYDEELLSVLKETLTDKAQYNILVGKISKLKRS